MYIENMSSKTLHIRRPKKVYSGKKKKPVAKAVKMYVKKKIESSKNHYVAQMYSTNSSGGWAATGGVGGSNAITLVMNITNPNYTGNVANSLASISGFGTYVYQGIVGARPNASDKLKFKDLSMRLWLPIVPGARINYRLILAVDRQARGAVANVNNILDNDNAVKSMYNVCDINVKERYRILFDKTVVTEYHPTQNLSSGSTTPTMITEYKSLLINKKLNVQTDYSLSASETLGSPAEIYDGMINLYIISDYTAPVSVGINYSIEYEDSAKKDYRRG